MMLDQDADEALVRPEDRAVEHDRPMPLAILADVGRVQQLGQYTIGLQRADLPGTADRILEVPLKLRRIEGPLARKLLPAELVIRHAGSHHRLPKLFFRFVPILVDAEAFVGPERELDLVSETEVVVDAARQFAEGARLLDDLVLAAKD